LDVQEDASLASGYALKRNSYDLGVDIELYDATQRLRFEHPQVAVVVITSGHPQVFCAGANINMLAQSSHGDKVNLCKFTNETRHAIEDATAHSKQTYVCALNGPAAGGGYELALACDYILLIDDGASTVSLPELPLLAVLPGTGGLTRLVDKRKVRHDIADFFLVPRSCFNDVVRERAQAFAVKSDRPPVAQGIKLIPLARTIERNQLTYDHLCIEIDRELGVASFMIQGPHQHSPQASACVQTAAAAFWPLALARELDDAILHLRFNEVDIGVWVFRSTGDNDLVQAVDAVLSAHQKHWLVREIILYLKRVFKRLDVSSRSLITLIEPGSCFTGMLLELVFAADRAYMLDGTFADNEMPPASIRPSLSCRTGETH
jgi:benzoyl-CoA-dihydrodiol lyase